MIYLTLPTELRLCMFTEILAAKAEQFLNHFEMERIFLNFSYFEHDLNSDQFVNFNS